MNPIFLSKNSEYSIELNGSNQYLSITDASQTGLDLTTDFSIGGWFKIDALPVSDFTIIDKKGGANTAGYRLQYNGSNDRLRVIYCNGGTDTRLESTTTAVATTWVHCVVTVDVSARTCTFYIDNVADTTITNQLGDSAIGGNSNDFVIGRRDSTANRYFDGFMKDVFVCNDLLTSGEVSDIYNNGLSSLVDGVSSYNMNQNANDGTGSNDLTENGSPTYSTDVP